MFQIYASAIMTATRIDGANPIQRPIMPSKQPNDELKVCHWRYFSWLFA